jgi:hypothetical protein
MKKHPLADCTNIIQDVPEGPFITPPKKHKKQKKSSIFEDRDRVQSERKHDKGDKKEKRKRSTSSASNEKEEKNNSSLSLIPNEDEYANSKIPKDHKSDLIKLGPGMFLVEKTESYQNSIRQQNITHLLFSSSAIAEEYGRNNSLKVII